ncbi:class III lanthionine synthetase LanKC [Planobispora takensis]|uniref:Serine/threonine protein kinase n=1 Tax=Planobispora takensis TaxID=1367882 RepID=A0A8J3SZV3_9ACTN|nr:class III lanthionine synthetase LanKC [Planobispora takensis]GII01395.1 serine/threonine protein kinase [Planobispora takensis]
MQYFGFTLAHPDYYEPPELGEPGEPYTPAAAPGGWDRRSHGVWTMWTPPRAVSADQGWKVHVCSSLENAQAVLDIVAGVCAELSIPFKHVSGSRFFLWLHHKHGPRTQSGKFCALYPPTRRIAHDLLVKLEDRLAGFAGPYILTDRRFGSSSSVAYRYGSFRERHRLRPDGTRQATMLDPGGREIPDERRPTFTLPPGVADPFAPEPAAGAGGPVTFGGYTFEAVVQHSNAGGAYLARTADGRRVFVKEARAHNGYWWDGCDAQTLLAQEHRTLRDLHELSPGICPEPIGVFAHWENSYLVSELVPGRTLAKWAVANQPNIRIGLPPEAFAGYYRRCLAILDRLKKIVSTLHELGYAFVDLNPRNVLIDEDEGVRLVDFEAACRIGAVARPMGAPGFMPPEALDRRSLAAMDTRRFDEFGLSAVAQALLFPSHNVLDRNGEAAGHLYRDLTDLAPVPDRLWNLATRFRRRPERPLMPAPEEVRRDPLTALRWLRDRTADAIEAAARPDDPHRIFPTTPQGLTTNTRCVAHGTAGVLHALRASGRPVDPRIVARLREESLRERDDTPPGLFFGNAGIAWVLADLGEVEAAGELLAAADRHPLSRTCATLGGGAAGVAMAHLFLHGRTGDDRHVERAMRTLAAIPGDAGLVPSLGPGDASGLVEGRPGIALALYYLSRFTGDPDMLERGARLLRDELQHGRPLETDALGFRVSETDGRNMPYLFAGSAGYAHVAARYLTTADDPVLADALRRSLRACSGRFAVAPALFAGQAGLGLALGQAAALLDRPDLAIREIEAGTALFKHAVPGRNGVRFLSTSLLMRFSADLWHGSAGVVLALSRILTGLPDPLFTLDAALTRPPVHPHHRERRTR